VTSRRTRPAPANSLRRSDRTDSLMPGTLRQSSAKLAGPLARGHVHRGGQAHQRLFPDQAGGTARHGVARVGLQLPLPRQHHRHWEPGVPARDAPQLGGHGDHHDRKRAAPGDSLTIVADEVTNPPSGSYTIGVATSSDGALVSLPFDVTAPD
jgi:hypothetical protein